MCIGCIIVQLESLCLVAVLKEIFGLTIQHGPAIAIIGSFKVPCLRITLRSVIARSHGIGSDDLRGVILHLEPHARRVVLGQVFRAVVVIYQLKITFSMVRTSIVFMTYREYP